MLHPDPSHYEYVRKAMQLGVHSMFCRLYTVNTIRVPVCGVDCLTSIFVAVLSFDRVFRQSPPGEARRFLSLSFVVVFLCLLISVYPVYLFSLSFPFRFFIFPLSPSWITNMVGCACCLWPCIVCSGYCIAT